MILSISERTDIINYYTPWFLNRLKAGFLDVKNPYNNKSITRIDLHPSNIDCLVFCSKNYTPILKSIKVIDKHYKIICHYTITAYESDFEAYVPPIEESIKTLVTLSKIIGKDKVTWRFDPLFLTEKYTISYILKKFEYIAKNINKHIYNCIISLVDPYEKFLYNAKEIIPFTESDKINLIVGIKNIANKYNIKLQSCAEELEYLNIASEGCTTQKRLEDTFNIEYEKIPVGSNRKNCRCIKTYDIGEYDTCLNSCKYCYANETLTSPLKKRKLHNPLSTVLIGEIKNDDIIKESKVKVFKEKKEKQLVLFD